MIEKGHTLYLFSSTLFRGERGGLDSGRGDDVKPTSLKSDPDFRIHEDFGKWGKSGDTMIPKKTRFHRRPFRASMDQTFIYVRLRHSFNLGKLPTFLYR